MQFSSRLPIATHILLAIAKFKDERKVTSNFLAESVNVNPVIIRKTLGQLKAAGLITVEAGIGGSSLTKTPAEITLLDVFWAVEEDEDLFHLHENPNQDCPVGKYINVILDVRLDSVQAAMIQKLASITLQTLIDDLDALSGGRPAADL